MNTILLISHLIQWGIILGLAFLLLGTLRSLGLLNWRLDELEVTRPTRMGRSGLKLGKKAPDFTLPDLAGGHISLQDYSGRKLLLVFVQPGCGPCHGIVPELNRLHRAGDVGVLVINNAEMEQAREWAEEVGPQFPAVIQQHWEVSKKYQIFATPFAYLIDEEGIITSRGVASSRQYLGYVLNDAGKHDKHDDAAPEEDSTVEPESQTSVSSKELTHV